MMMRLQQDPRLHSRESTLAHRQPLFRESAQAGGELHTAGALQLSR